MSIMSKLLLLLCMVAGCWLRAESSEGPEWTYSGEHGPEHWHELHGYETCASKSQSPIDLKNPELDTTMGAITMTGYDQTPAGLEMSMSNNGHSITVSVSGADMTSTGGKLPGTYKLAQFHFHWGSHNKRGSEHHFNGKAHGMEVHLVHYNTKFASFGEAVDQPEGLAVFGFVMDISEEDNEAFEVITGHIQNVTHKGESIVLAPFALTSILPTDLSEFYRYSGSLTTPPCHESVVWTVFNSNIKISNNQLDRFRTTYLNERDDVPLVDNHRPIQPLNGRTITSNFKTSGGATFHSHWTAGLFASVFAVLLAFN